MCNNIVINIFTKKIFVNLIFIADIAILTLTKYLQNLLRDSTLSAVSAAKNVLLKVVLIMLKMPSETFL